MEKTGTRKRKVSNAPRFGSILHLSEVQRAYGDEPIWVDVTAEDPNLRVKIANALNWGNAAFDDAMLKKITLDFFKENEEYSFLKDIHEQYFHSVGLQCWLRSNNAPLDSASDEFFQTCLGQLKDRYTKNCQEKEKEREEELRKEMENVKISAEQEAKIQYADLFAEIDNCVLKNEVSSEKIYEFLRDKSPSVAVLRLLLSHYEDNVSDAETYYKNNPIKSVPLKVKNYVNTLRDNSATVLAQISKILNNTKAEIKLQKIRRPRKKKIKPANMQIRSLQFKERDEGLKLVSIPPTSVISAPTLVVFNTKTRKVGMYVAKTTDGLSVKGTTIQNYDEEKSTQKTLRKPEEMLPMLTDYALRRFEKVFEDIKAVDTKLNGRINTDVLLIKVFKK